MKFNFTFIGQFIGGVACFILAYLVMDGGSSGGFVFKALGIEAQIKSFLLAGVGVYLCFLPFQIPPEIPVKWRDIFYMFGIIFLTEVVAHILAIPFR